MPAPQPLSTVLLTRLTGIDAALAARCQPTLRLFVLWPAAVASRSYWTGEALVERRTKVGVMDSQPGRS